MLLYNVICCTTMRLCNKRADLGPIYCWIYTNENFKYLILSHLCFDYKIAWRFDLRFWITNQDLQPWIWQTERKIKIMPFGFKTWTTSCKIFNLTLWISACRIKTNVNGEFALLEKGCYLWFWAYSEWRCTNFEIREFQRG